MKRLLLMLALCALTLAAQEPTHVQKLIPLKYADPNGVVRLINVFGLDNIQLDTRMKVLSVSGRADRVSAAEAAIKQLDVPAAQERDIELTVYFIVASDKENLTGNAVPQDLQPVITQMKSAFAFKNYRMLDVLTIRTRSGAEASTSGVLNAGPGAPGRSEFKVRSATVSEDATIRIDRLQASLSIPYTVTKSVSAGTRGGSAERQVQFAQSGIEQNIDVKEGQKVVVGRTSLEGPDKALFLVLMAHAIS